MSANNIKRYSLDELHKLKSKTNLVKIDALTTNEIEQLADEEDQEMGNEWDWDSSEIVYPERKQSVHLRLDPEILNFFRGQGPGYQTRINQVLRSYVNRQLQR
jgi:uncharacterized protein (DUF4415 family)